jgi:hypothetical protein
MPLIHEPINTLAQPLPSGTSAARLELNRRYHAISLQCFAQAQGEEKGPVAPETIISRVRFIVNGKEMFNLSPKRIKQINAANLFADTANNLTLYLAEPWQEGIVEATKTAWQMYWESSFTMEIDFRDLPVTTQLEVRAIQHYDTKVLLGLKNQTTPVYLTLPYAAAVAKATAEGSNWGLTHVIIKKLGLSLGSLSQGKQTLTERFVGERISRLWYFKTDDTGVLADQFTAFRLVADGGQMFDLRLAEAKEVLAKHAMVLPDTVLFAMAFDLDGSTDYLQAKSSLLMEPTCAGAINADAVAETVNFAFPR